jgi:hypothetical protein
MSEQLQYYAHQPDQRSADGQDILTRPNEAHELAADIQRVGAIALHSDALAARETQADVAVTVPNPIASAANLRPGRGVLPKSRERAGRINMALDVAHLALTHLQDEVRSPEISDYGSRITPLREATVNPNANLILDGANVPPFLSALKEDATQSDGGPADESWQRWFGKASDEQLTNFSQWYTESLRTLAVPERKAAYVESLKSGYADLVSHAMDDGWIDPRHQTTLARRLAATEVRFFSPFGHMPDEFAGVAQRRGRGNALVLLPTVPGPEMVTHELGHVFAGVDDQGMRRYFERQLGKRAAAQEMLVLNHLYTMLNEGFDEHLTAALLNGHPEIVSPQQRLSMGIAEVPGSSESYQTYREVLSVLLGGSEQQVAENDISFLVDSAVNKDFDAFARQLDSKWKGRPVLTEVVRIIGKHDRASWQHTDDPNYEQQLAQELIAYLKTDDKARLIGRLAPTSLSA